MQQRLEDGTRCERTGWRDAEISGRHRMWGFNCPAADLDFLMCEYNLGLPVGLVEYKHHQARMPDLRHPTYRALTTLCDGYNDNPLPFFVAFYWPDIWAFKVIPVNAKAHELVRVPGTTLTERDYVRGLYIMRRLVVTSEVLDRLNDTLPAEDNGAVEVA